MRRFHLPGELARAARRAVIALAATAATAAAQSPDRGTRPPLGPVPDVDLPDARRATLDNGLKLVTVPKHGVPLVQVNIQVHAGHVLDPGDRPGLASLTADMMDEGAAGRSALEIADAFEQLGARFSIGARRHTTDVSLRVPVGRLDAALALAADVLLRPDFPAEELERKRAERLTALIRRHDEPNAIANVLFGRVLFGADHPYGRDGAGDERSLRAMTVEDLRAFHDARFVPSNATVIVAGDIDPEDARNRIGTAFGAWSGDPAPAPVLSAPPQVRGRTVYLVDKPGSVQSVIAIGRIGVARDHPDYYALEVMNTILGGSFTSRLNQNLREDKGYTYGARSSFDFGLVPGAFRAGAAVQTQSTGPALAEFMKELEGMRTDIPEEEVHRARNNLAMGFIQGFQSVAQVAGQVGEVVEYGLPDGWLDEYVDRVLAVESEDVRRVAREYVDPANLVIVVVGDRSSVEAPIRALDLGQVHVLSVTDVLGAVPSMDRPEG